MALKRLPIDIQHLLSASTQINSYKRAIDELVYNSLDASSTSVAIRVHIEEDTIQVVDNGYGIAKRDFGLLGLKYMTSKYIDMNNFKSVPNKYGFRGESLANIIKMSQTVKVISRHESGEETWMKTFCNGKEKDIKELTARPSKGTTVEVKGFLYNLSIQKKATNTMHVIQDIKTSLEQLSLIHSHISLSLRDDSKNEIVFKMHKNRDIYQTLSSLFGIEKPDFQELTVEKKQYKVTGIIGKTEEVERQWFFLNGKFVNNCKLHKIIHDLMAKFVCRDQGNRRAKFMSFKGDADMCLFKHKSPFYFIFLTCPYINYDVSYTPKKSVLEFKDWDQIKKLLEKLIKFYTGDINLKEIKKPDTKLVNVEQDQTRHEVKKIMEKILGGNSKKLGVAHLQKGIKGKCIKRKSKEKLIKKFDDKIIPPKNDDGYSKSDNALNVIELDAVNTHFGSNNINSDYKINKKSKKKVIQERLSSEAFKSIQERTASKHTHNRGSNTIKKNICHKLIIKNTKQCKQDLRGNEKNQNKSNFINRKGTNKIKDTKDSLNRRFENPTDSLKMRCDIIARKAEFILECRKRRRLGKMKEKQTKEFDNKPSNNKIVPVNKETSNIYTHDYTPLPLFNRHNNDEHRWKNKQERTAHKTTYDLVHTILKTQQLNTQFERAHNPIKTIENSLEVCRTDFIPNNSMNSYKSNSQFLSKLTFDSHYYNYNVNHRTMTAKVAQKFTSKLRNTHFITEESQNNFKFPIKKRINIRNPYDRYINTKKTFHKATIINIDNSIKDNRAEERSYTIAFSENNYHETYSGAKLKLKSPLNITNHEDNRTHASNQFDAWHYEANCNMENTYTVLSSAMLQDDIPVLTDVKRPLNFSRHEHRRTYTVSNSKHTLNNVNENCDSNTYVNDVIEANNESMCMFTSKSQTSNAKVIFDTIIEPLNICETILSNDDSDERVVSNKAEVGYCNNTDVVINNKDKSINFPYHDENEININHDNKPNNHVNISENVLNMNVCKEKSDFTDCQAIEIETNNLEKVSHHFDTTNSSNLTLKPLNNKECNETPIRSPILSSKIIQKDKENVLDQKKLRLEILQEMEANNKDNENEKKEEFLNLNKSNDIQIDLNNFNLKNRLNFIPKGMSPIFANCNNKGIRDFNLERDYYKDNIYNDFINEVQVNSEVFEPRIENMKCLTTKDIEKVNNKLDKDNASLIFNGESLKGAKVLGQVDGKFIAAIINGKCNIQNEVSEFLILFDQHAVHERIRLEKNLSDYINNDQWKSIPLDDISLTISKDEMLCLHNYMDKFYKFGLQWTFLSNNVISINAIPEAILGKNPRPVDKVLRAVKNLISEEMNMIKLQKGCVSLYPKSIMDLVFSEACRYAIKFGDNLSNTDCADLLKALSECKTPFQCAHGRPVMAVLMDYKCANHKYKINYENLQKFYSKK